MSLSSWEETEVRPWVEEKRVIFHVSLALIKRSPRASIGEGHESFLMRENNYWARRARTQLYFGFCSCFRVCFSFGKIGMKFSQPKGTSGTSGVL